MTIRALVILVAICFSANAFARDKPPKVGNKPLVLVEREGLWHGIASTLLAVGKGDILYSGM